MSKVCLKVLAGSRECFGLVVESRLISTTHHLLSTTICASVYQLIIGCTRPYGEQPRPMDGPTCPLQPWSTHLEASDHSVKRHITHKKQTWVEGRCKNQLNTEGYNKFAHLCQDGRVKCDPLCFIWGLKAEQKLWNPDNLFLKQFPFTWLPGSSVSESISKRLKPKGFVVVQDLDLIGAFWVNYSWPVISVSSKRFCLLEKNRTSSWSRLDRMRFCALPWGQVGQHLLVGKLRER